MVDGIAIPMPIKAGDFYFNPMHLCVVDEREYRAKERGAIKIWFLGQRQVHELTGREAEDFHIWWLQVTGQAQVQAPPPGLRF